MEELLRMAAALGFVLALLFGLAWLARRYDLPARLAGATGPAKERRLAIVETLALDPRRRLVLVRRDGVEHLLLLGGATDVALERIPDGPR